MKLSNKVRKWLRIIHRDLGYLLVGISIIYGISGFLLNHMDGKDPAYESIHAKVDLPAGLSKQEVEEQCSSNDELPLTKGVLSADEGFYRVLFNGGIGIYNIKSGELDYEFHRQKKFIYYINKFHYNKVKGWTWIADVFAFSLIFLAVSGLFIVPGKKGIKGRGKYYLVLGIAIPIVYVLLS